MDDKSYRGISPYVIDEINNYVKQLTHIKGIIIKFYLLFRVKQYTNTSVLSSC